MSVLDDFLGVLGLNAIILCMVWIGVFVEGLFCISAVSLRDQIAIFYISAVSLRDQIAI